MKTKTTLLFLVIAGGLFGFMRLYEAKHPSTREAALRATYLLPFDRDAIDEIVLTRYGNRIKLHRNGDRWDLETPVKDHADPKAVDELLNQCQSLTQEAVLGAKKKDTKRFNDCGLGPEANVRLQLLGRHAPPELLFGNVTAVEGKYYARLDGKPNIYIVGDDLRKLIVRETNTLRDHQLTELDATLATRLLFKTPAGEIALSKTGGHWGLDKPIKGRAADMRVSEFAGDIFNMPIAAFAPEDATLSACGLSEPRGSVTIWTLGGTTPVTLQIGAHDEKADQAYAQLSNRNAICLLPKQIERILMVVPDDFRDNHLLRVDMDMVDRLAIESAGHPRLILKRQQDDWVQLDHNSSPRPVNPAKVQAFIKALQTGTVAFVDDVASDLPKYGLDHPQRRVTFASYASENTAETTAGEHPLLTVDFGISEGKKVYARLEDEPFVVSVDESLLNEISGDPAEWRPLTVFNFRPQEIATLEVTWAPGSGTSAASQPATISLKRSGGVWKSEGASGVVNSINVQSLVNTIANLSAVCWTGSDTTALKAPTETIVFRTAGGKSGKLLLGTTSAGHGCDAMVEGDTAVFTLSSPDESALRLPLVSQ